MNKTGLYVFASVFILFGLIGLASTARVVNTGSQSKSWEHTTGTISASQVSYAESTDSRSSPTPYAKVRFEYKVEGTSFEGTRVDLDRVSEDLGDVQATVSQYTVGKKISVYYDPKNPESSLLEPGVPWREVKMVSGGSLIFLLFGVLVLVTSKNSSF